MKPFTIREWGKLPYGDGEGQIPDEMAGRLAAVAAASPLSGRGGGGVLEHGRHALRARGVVGVISARDCTLEILPKIDVGAGKDVEHQNAEIRKRLIHMLAVALDLKIDLGAMTELALQRETLLEILIRIFSQKLTDAVRQGIPRRYVEHEDDLPALRGTLNITRQFTHLAVNPARLACRFDLLSEDIALNRIMKTTVSHLARMSKSTANQRRLRELSFVYAQIADVPAPALRWDSVAIDRTNRRWQDLLSMAQLFLRNQYQTTTHGKGQGTALLFEMSALFEDYVGRMISRALVGSGMTVSVQGGRRFCLTSEDTQKGLFQTKPDILIYARGVVTHVIDTKWKWISSRIDDPKQGVSQGDVYQMMAYGHLYGAPRLTLLYPHHAGLGDQEGIHSRSTINGHDAVKARDMILETASIDVANGSKIPERLWRWLLKDRAAAHDIA